VRLVAEETKIEQIGHNLHSLSLTKVPFF